MKESPLSRAIWLSPAAAAVAPAILLLAVSLPSMAAEEWLRLPFWLPFFELWSLMIGYPIALLHMALAWLLYCWLRPHFQLRWWSAGAAGGVIGGLPVAMLQGVSVLPSNMLGFRGPELPLLLGWSGMVGGLVFWWILRPRRAEACGL